MRRRWYRKYLPGWFVINPGGGGGGTVTTDGVTIQGNGSAGSPIALLDAETDGVTLQGAGIAASKLALKAVQTAARLTGAGTVASPLDVAGWPLTWFATNPGGTAGAQQFTYSANTLYIAGVLLLAPVRFSNITVDVAVVDAVHNCDLGFYTYAGNLVANIGPQTIPSLGLQTFATVQGVVTLPPGRYFFATTSVGTTAALLWSTAPGSILQFQSNGIFGASAGGVLPAMIVPPADSLTANTYYPVFILF